MSRGVRSPTVREGWNHKNEIRQDGQDLQDGIFLALRIRERPKLKRLAGGDPVHLVYILFVK